MTFAASNMINELLLAEDFVKAIQWMSLLNLRDHYPFEQVFNNIFMLPVGYFQVFLSIVRSQFF